MRVARDLDTLRAAAADLRAGGRALASVPTTWARCARATWRRSRRLAPAAAASAFVNPLQIGARGPARPVAAARLGTVRLLDNLPAPPGRRPQA